MATDTMRLAEEIRATFERARDLSRQLQGDLADPTERKKACSLWFSARARHEDAEDLIRRLSAHEPASAPAPETAPKKRKGKKA